MNISETKPWSTFSAVEGKNVWKKEIRWSEFEHREHLWLIFNNYNRHLVISFFSFSEQVFLLFHSCYILTKHFCEMSFLSSLSESKSRSYLTIHFYSVFHSYSVLKSRGIFVFASLSRRWMKCLNEKVLVRGDEGVYSGIYVILRNDFLLVYNVTFDLLLFPQFLPNAFILICRGIKLPVYLARISKINYRVLDICDLFAIIYRILYIILLVERKWNYLCSSAWISSWKGTAWILLSM